MYRTSMPRNAHGSSAPRASAEPTSMAQAAGPPPRRGPLQHVRGRVARPQVAPQPRPGLHHDRLAGRLPDRQVLAAVAQVIESSAAVPGLDRPEPGVALEIRGAVADDHL